MKKEYMPYIRKGRKLYLKKLKGDAEDINSYMELIVVSVNLENHTAKCIDVKNDALGRYFLSDLELTPRKTLDLPEDFLKPVREDILAKRPRNGETYYTVNLASPAGIDTRIWSSDDTDSILFERGFVMKSEEEALREVRAIIKATRLRQGVSLLDKKWDI